jgi:hypothetical protein
MDTPATTYEGSSGTPDGSTMRILPPVDAKISDTPGLVGSIAGLVDFRARWNFTLPINVACNFNSHAFASITELTVNPDTGHIDKPFIGNAHMYIRSVAPQKNKLFVSGYIDFDRDLDVRINLFIV